MQKYFTERTGIDCRLVNGNGKIFYNNTTYFDAFLNNKDDNFGKIQRMKTQ
jgi:hypothetical protein